MTFIRTKNKKLLIACVTSMAMLYPASSQAQVAPAPQIPSAADPSRIVPQNIQPEQNQTPAARPLQVSGNIDEFAIEGADQVVLDLKEIKFEGVTAFPLMELMRDAEKIYGPQSTLQDVIDILNNLNRRYRVNGYIAARAFFPEQDVTDGVITINVVEGFIGNIRVENPAHAESSTINAQLQKMKDEKPFNIYEFERAVLTLNNLAGTSFKSILKPTDSTDMPGALDVVLVETPLLGNVSVSLDNYGSQYAGPYQLTVAGTRSSVLFPYDEMSLQLFTSVRESELLFGQFQYAKPSPSIPGLKYVGSYSTGFTEAGSNLKPLEIKGYVREGKIGFSYFIPFSRQDNLTFAGNFTVKNAYSKILGEELYTDRLRVLRASAMYQGTDSWNGINSVYSEVSKGLNIMGARPEGSENLSRADGESDFTKLTAQYMRLQSLPKNFQLYGQVQSQYSFNPLLSSEEFGFGGGSMGRGYDPSEITGDDGVSASVELRYNFSPNDSSIQLIQPYVFFDIGKVWQKGDVEPKAISAASAGVGARLYHKENFTLNLNLAFPLTLSTSNPPKYTNEHGGRILFSLTKTF